MICRVSEKSVSEKEKRKMIEKGCGEEREREGERNERKGEREGVIEIERVREIERVKEIERVRDH